MSLFYSHGKLLLTAEYVVLDGAKALALPTKKGQLLKVSPSPNPGIYWKSVLHDDSLWFEHHFDPDSLSREKWQHPNPIIERLQQILKVAFRMSATELSKNTGYELTTTLEFARDWGLGSSSTLIAAIAQWLNIDPYHLLSNTFGGSGYDIACATATGPICYQKLKGQVYVEACGFDPPFKEALFFVHLNTKQNSRESIQHYKSLHPKENQSLVKTIDELTAQILKAETLQGFDQLLERHESALSKALQLPTVKQRLFPDYPGMVKSLGGWGGDFVLATGDKAYHAYFKKKGYNTIIPYSDMIL